MGLLTPEWEGSVDARGAGAELLERIARRTDAGTFPVPGGGGRYRIVDEAPREAPEAYRVSPPPQRLRIVAVDAGAQRQIGLNDITMWLEGGRLRYHVAFHGWARFVATMVAVFNVLGLVLLPVAIASKREDPNAWFELAQPIFLGFIWPWVLGAMLIKVHPRFARRRLEEALSEIMDGVPSRDDARSAPRQDQAREGASVEPSARVRVASPLTRDEELEIAEALAEDEGARSARR